MIHILLLLGRPIRRCWSCQAILCAVLVGSCTLLGPRSADATPLYSVAPTIPDSLATITTDTGAFAPGRKDFILYRTPGMCLAAAENVRGTLRRSLAAQAILDTIRTTVPERDTLPREVIAVARACGGHFTVAQATPWDLPDLFQLALLAERDSVANAVVQRHVAMATSLPAKGQLLQEAARAYLAAEPARVTAAETAVAQVDALGPAAAAARLAAHQVLLDFGTQTFNRVRLQQEAERIIALGQTASFDSIKYHWGPLYYAYVALGKVAYFEHPDSARIWVPQLTRRAMQDLARFPSGRRFPDGVPYGDWALVDWKTESLQDAERHFAGTQDVATLGTVLPPLEATYWFPAKPDHWPPGSGPFALIVNRRDGAHGEGVPTYPNTELHRWADLYGPRGLSITLVTDTYGFGVRSGPLPAAAEAANLKWYYVEYQRLPVTLAVVRDSMLQWPPPDGRRFACTIAGGFGVRASRTEFWNVCRDTISAHARYTAPVTLVAHDGRVLYRGETGPLFEAVLARAMAEGASGATRMVPAMVRDSALAPRRTDGSH